MRNEEIIGRIGGEEFAIFLTDTHIENAFIVADKLRSEIENTFISIEDSEVRFTISIGLASFDNTYKNSNVLLKNADQALYKAKALGRNRVEIFTR